MEIVRTGEQTKVAVGINLECMAGTATVGSDERECFVLEQYSRTDMDEIGIECLVMTTDMYGMPKVTEAVFQYGGTVYPAALAADGSKDRIRIN